MLASRGMEIDAVYYHTFPYTSDLVKEKVLDLARILTIYTGRMRVHVVDFTKIQLALQDHSPPEMLTVLTRRMMMRLAEKIALQNKQKALITGESLGQVASQTLEALLTTDTVVDLPVFRPLIGLDKVEVIKLARSIGTYETSILPYDDCCTVFVAKHPKTHPTLADASRAEDGLPIEQMLAETMTKIEVIEL
jgi:thiamine biosynthesis protein ThiI